MLEDRSVPASLLSALGVGNDAGGTSTNDMAVDTARNRYLTGYFSGTNDFVPARTHPSDADVLTARGSGDAFVAKYAPGDTLVCARRMGGESASSTVSHTSVAQAAAVASG